MISTTATCRLATADDLPAVARLIVALRDETVWRHVAFTPNAEFIETWLWRTLTTLPTHALFVAEQDGQVIGFIGGELVTEYFVPDQPVLTEWGWYVEPAHRGKRVGWDLWHALVDWGKALGAVAAVRTKTVPVRHLRTPAPFEVRIWVPLEG